MKWSGRRRRATVTWDVLGTALLLLACMVFALAAMAPSILP